MLITSMQGYTAQRWPDKRLSARVSVSVEQLSEVDDEGTQRVSHSPDDYDQYEFGDCLLYRRFGHARLVFRWISNVILRSLPEDVQCLGPDVNDSVDCLFDISSSSVRGHDRWTTSDLHARHYSDITSSNHSVSLNDPDGLSELCPSNTWLLLSFNLRGLSLRLLGCLDGCLLARHG